MDILSIIRQAWQITSKRWELWLLSAAMLILSLPVFAFSFSYGFAHGLASAYRSDPSTWLKQEILDPALLLFLSKLSPAVWIGLGLAATLLVTVFMPGAVFLQAAMSRIVIYAHHGQPSGLRPAFAFNRRQVLRILLLGLLTGLVNGLLAVVPVAVAELSPQALNLSGAAQTLLSPIGMLAGLVLVILLIAVSVEDLLPPAPTRRTRDVFKTAWWAFLVVFIISSLLGLAAVIILALPAAPLIALSLVFDTAWIVTLPCGSCLSLAALLFWIFTAVFTLALNTLVYRSAAERFASQAKQDQPGKIEF